MALASGVAVSPATKYGMLRLKPCTRLHELELASNPGVASLVHLVQIDHRCVANKLGCIVSYAARGLRNCMYIIDNRCSTAAGMRASAPCACLLWSYCRFRFGTTSTLGTADRAVVSPQGTAAHV